MNVLEITVKQDQEKSLLTPIGDGPTKSVTTNPIAIKETNGTPNYAPTPLHVPKIVLLKESPNKNIRETTVSKPKVINYPLDMLPNINMEKMSDQELILWILTALTNNSCSKTENSVLMSMFPNSHADLMELFISSKWTEMVEKVNTPPTKPELPTVPDIVMLNAHMI
jgi:hypothetical protein